MIGYFPTPYPDELFYSICARYSAHLGCSNEAYVIESLFGERFRPTTLVLPNRIDQLTSRLPKNSFITTEYLILNHTFFPLYTPFILRERQSALYSEMANSSEGKAILGPASNKTTNVATLGYCPVCAEEDRRVFGEAYWHRSHQGKNMGVCYKHEVQLEYFDLPRRGQVMMYLPAEQHIFPTVAREVSRTPLNDALLKLSQDLHSVLNGALVDTNVDDFSAVIREELIDRGIARRQKNAFVLVDKSSEMIRFGTSTTFELMTYVGSYKSIKSWEYQYKQAFRLSSKVGASLSPLACLAGLQYVNLSPRDIKKQSQTLTTHDISVADESQKKTVPQDKIAIRRQEFLTILAENPEITRTNINKNYSYMYKWFLLHDKEWYEKNAPKPKMAHEIASKTNTQEVDWSQRDDEAYKEVLNVYHAALNDLENRPKRISASFLSNHVQLGYSVQQNLKKMPKTAQLVNGLVETVDEIILRRIKWLINQFITGRRSSAIPNLKTTLMKESGAYEILDRSETVERAIQEAIRAIQSTTSHTYVVE